MAPDKPAPRGVNLPAVRAVPDVAVVGAPTVTQASIQQAIGNTERCITKAYTQSPYSSTLSSVVARDGVTVVIPDTHCKALDPNAPDWHKPKAALRGDSRTKKPWEH